MRQQLDRDGRTRPGEVGMIDGTWEEDGVIHGGDDWELRCRSGFILIVDVASDTLYKDDLTGQPLDPKLVKEARRTKTRRL